MTDIQELSTEEIVEKLQKHANPIVNVPFPRTDPETGKPYCEIAVRSISGLEQQAAAVAAQREAARLLKDVDQVWGTNDVLNNAKAHEWLMRACRNPNDPKKPFFANKAQLLEVLTPDEIAVLFNHCLTVQRTFSPITEYVSQEEVETWARRIRDAGEKAIFLLNTLSADGLISLLLGMAYLPAKSQTVQSSSTASVESSGNSESNDTQS